MDDGAVHFIELDPAAGIAAAARVTQIVVSLAVVNQNVAMRVGLITFRVGYEAPKSGDSRVAIIVGRGVLNCDVLVPVQVVCIELNAGIQEARYVNAANHDRIEFARPG